MKHILKAITCVALCSALLACGNVNRSSAATQHERDAQSSQNQPAVQPTPEPTSTPLSEKDIKRREEIHKLMLAGKYAHDGAGELLYIGDMSSVPALLRALKDNPPKNGGMICTTAHILQALRKITNHNAGTTYEEWNAWWEQYQKEKKANAGGQPNKGMHPTADTMALKFLQSLRAAGDAER